MKNWREEYKNDRLLTKGFVPFLRSFVRNIIFKLTSLRVRTYIYIYIHTQYLILRDRLLKRNTWSIQRVLITWERYYSINPLHLCNANYIPAMHSVAFSLLPYYRVNARMTTIHTFREYKSCPALLSLSKADDINVSYRRTEERNRKR